jgi:hypothetical protein
VAALIGRGWTLVLLTVAMACTTPPPTVRPLSAEADSTALIETALSGAVGLSDADLADAAAEVHERSRASASRLDVAVVEGYHRSFSVSGTFAPGVRVVARSARGRSAGFLQIPGVVAGGIRPRVGEGVILGARTSAFDSPRFHSGPRKLSASGTGSLYDAAVGVGGAVEYGRHRAAMVGWRRDGREELWGAVERWQDRGGVGLAVGFERVPSGAGAQGALVYGGVRRDPAGVSFETAWYHHRLFAAVRTVIEAAGRWSVEMFDKAVPSGFSNPLISPDDLGRRRWGASAHHLGHLGAVRTRVSAHGVGESSASREKRRERVELALEGRTADDSRWEVSARYTGETAWVHSTSVARLEDETVADAQQRLKIRWTGPRGHGWRQRYTAALQTREPLGGVGFVVGVSVERPFTWGDAVFGVSSYAVASGQTAYVARPGVSGYETIGVVSNTGSDVSCRFRVEVGGVRAALYWGQPWGKPPRVYASASFSV